MVILHRFLLELYCAIKRKINKKLFIIYLSEQYSLLQVKIIELVPPETRLRIIVFNDVQLCYLKVRSIDDNGR